MLAYAKDLQVHHQHTVRLFQRIGDKTNLGKYTTNFMEYQQEYSMAILAVYNTLVYSSYSKTNMPFWRIAKTRG
jgi:hypothetical protein